MNYYLFSNKKRADVVISFDNDTIDGNVLDGMNNIIQNSPVSTRIGFDLKNVKTINHEFFSVLKEYSLQKDISLFNISPEINFLLNIMNFNQYASMYVDENDFSENKRSLVKRNFKFCPN